MLQDSNGGFFFNFFFGWEKDHCGILFNTNLKIKYIIIIKIMRKRLHLDWQKKIKSCFFGYVGSRFVVQNNYALAQRVQDNKFVDSGLGNWALANLGYHHHRFKDNFNENTETNGKRSSIQEAFFLYQVIFFICNSW